MNNTQAEILKKKLSLELSEEKISIFNKYEKLFLEKNSHTNLISKNDEKLLFEKHIFDSLAINLFFKSRNIENKSLLDIGTGGGFPSVPVSIIYDKLNVFALDSIRKKINLIEEIKNELNLINLTPVCNRAENLKPQKFDYITTRAVAPIDKILSYSVPLLTPKGCFIAYKSKNALNELKEAEKTMKKLNIKVKDIIEYTLPLEETFKRNLILFGLK